MRAKKVAIFCGASEKISPIYFSEMELLARGLVEAGIGIVFGGANQGLMRKLAEVTLRSGGNITGVIPRSLHQPGWVCEGLTELIVVDRLTDRKRLMIELSDAALAFPGGVGTLDEATEIMALRQVGEISHPLLFLNFLDFWKPFFDYLTLLEQGQWIHDRGQSLYLSFDSSEEVVKYLGGGLPL